MYFKATEEQVMQLFLNATNASITVHEGYLTKKLTTLDKVRKQVSVIDTSLQNQAYYADYVERHKVKIVIDITKWKDVYKLSTYGKRDQLYEQVYKKPIDLIKSVPEIKLIGKKVNDEFRFKSVVDFNTAEKDLNLKSIRIVRSPYRLHCSRVSRDVEYEWVVELKKGFNGRFNGSQQSGVVHLDKNFIVINAPTGLSGKLLNAHIKNIPSEIIENNFSKEGGDEALT